MRRPAGRRLRADGAPNAESHFKPDAQTDTRAQQAPDAITDARTLAEANTAAHTYADAAPIAVAERSTWRPDAAPGLQPDA